MNEEQKLKIKDKKWRLNNFYTIVDKNQEAVTFKQNEAQAHYAENRHVRNIILKSRQLGFTTLGAIDCLDEMAFNPNTHILFLAHIKEEAQRIFSHKIKYAWEHFKLSKYYEDIKSDAGTLEVGFGKSKEGSKFDSAHSSIYVSNSGRSGTYARIHVTELAKMEHVNAERTREFIRGTIPALPIQCRIDIESCVTGSTLIETDKGLIKIGDLFTNKIKGHHKISGLKLWGRDGYQKSPQIFYNGVSKNKKITTQSGYSITSSLKHPLLTISKDGISWGKTSDLSIGDYIAIKKGGDKFGDIDFTKGFVSHSKKGTRFNVEKFDPIVPNINDLCYFLGLFLAEGYCRYKKSGNYIIISSGDEYVHENLEKWTGINWIRNDKFHSRCTRTSLVEFIHKLGFKINSKAPKKEIPEFVLSLPEEQMCSFISGMFDGDGTSHGTRGTVSYRSTSKEMIMRLQILLLKLGMFSQIRITKPHIGGVINGRQIIGKSLSYSLELGLSESKIFYEKIGFRLNRKQIRRRIVDDSRIGNEEYGQKIPLVTSGLLKETILKKGSSYSKLHKKGISSHGYMLGRGIYQKKLREIIQLLSLDNKDLLELAYSDYRWERIISMEDNIEETFDVVVPVNQSFIGNGIVNHNTAEGNYGLFFEMFKNAMERWSFMEEQGIPPMSTDWKPHFYNWTWDKEEIAKVERIIPMSEMRKPEFFMELKRKMALSDQEISYYYIKYQSLNYDMEALKQEYPSTWEEAFVSSGGVFFSPELLQNQRGRTGIKHGEWTVYAKYDATHTYTMGVDTAGGRGGDNATICILDTVTGEQVAEFASDRTEPHILAIEAVSWAKKYGNAFMVPEINNHGLAFVNKVKDLNYYNVYSRMVYDKDMDEERNEIGFNTNVKTKPLLLYGLSFALSEMSIFVYSEQLLKELQAYPKRQLDDLPTIKQVRTGQLKHFDRVMALALAWEGIKNGATDRVKTETYLS